MSICVFFYEPILQIFLLPLSFYFTKDQFFLYLYRNITSLFFYCLCTVTVIVIVCHWVLILGVWGELACHKRLFRRRQIQIDNQILNPVFSKCVFPRRRPPKIGVFDGGVASFRAKKPVLSLRARRDDFKLVISDASSMKGLSTMQKSTKTKTFLATPARASLAEDDGPGRFCWPARPPSKQVILLVNRNKRFRQPRSP